MKKWLMVLALVGVTGFSVADDTPDARVGHALDALGIDYMIDEDGDYRLLLFFDDDRSQIVYVRSRVHSYASHQVREIWAPGYVAPINQFPADVANRLLEASNASVLGGWVKMDTTAMFVVKVDADAHGDKLHDAIFAAASSADNMEEELTGTDDL